MKSFFKIEKDKNHTEVLIKTEADGSYTATIETDDKCLWSEYALEKIENSIRSAKLMKKAYKISIKGGTVIPVLEALYKHGFVETTSSDDIQAFELVCPLGGLGGKKRKAKA